jgi:hypothetical protein
MSSGDGPWSERCIATTCGGHICNVGENTQLDDQIAIIAGCRMPLILRPQEDGTFKVTGHTYVFGMMYGEAIDKGIESQRILLS